MPRAVPTEMNPSRLEAVARAVASDAKAGIFVLSGADLLKEGLHLLHAVGQAARHAPRYIELTHKGDPANPEDVILLVGKGITFDSGGLNIKPTGSMEDMHMDMGGSAAVLGAFRALTQLGVKRNVVAVLAVAENAIDANSFKPHNIIRSHKGLTVEIKNTDAEGRLVLADALSFAQSRVKPHTIIDLATLTGACIIALGEYAAGLFSNNGALREGLATASAARFERLWPMPIFPEHREEIKAAAMADLQSTGAGRYGGSCTAAAFLENFIGTATATPAWAHLDIAGPAMYGKARGHMNAGGTGFGVQVIAQYVLSAPKGALPADAKKKY
jgi:leucyl aminopeptidase